MSPEKLSCCTDGQDCIHRVATSGSTTVYRWLLMTINVIHFDRPKTVAGFTVIRHCVHWMRPVRFSSQIFFALFASFGLIPVLRCFFGQTISLFHLRLGIWSFHHFRRYNILCIEPSSMDFWRVQIFQLLNVCDQDVSFPDSRHAQRISKEYTWQDFWAELMQSRQVFSRNKVIFHHRSKRNKRSFKWFDKSPFIQCFSICQEVLSIFAGITWPLTGSPNRFS